MLPPMKMMTTPVSSIKVSLLVVTGETKITASFDIVELQWLEHLWNHENMFETGVVRANEC